MAETLDDPAEILSQLSDRLNLGSGAEEQEANRKRHYLHEDAGSLGSTLLTVDALVAERSGVFVQIDAGSLGYQRIDCEQSGTERIACKTGADTANFATLQRTTNRGDEIAVRPRRGKRLDQNFQLTIATVKKLRIK